MPRKPSSKETASVIPSDLTGTELDLFSHMQNGCELETDSWPRPTPAKVAAKLHLGGCTAGTESHTFHC
jgi:hypothetical protein